MNNIEYLEKELTELYDTGKIESGVKLNRRIIEIMEAVSDKEKLNYQVPPTYNFHNLDKPTVFCHLNPGGNPSIKSFQSRLKKFKNATDFIYDYKLERISYPKRRFIEKKQFDNFDYKQALFLSGFPNNSIEFKSITSEKLIEDERKMSIDCHNVLTQKTQLELIPFESKSFKGIFENVTRSEKIFPFVESYFTDLMDIIVQHPRKYVIFGSKQYHNLFKIADKKYKLINSIKSTISLDIGTKNRAYVSVLNMSWKRKTFNALIAHSFPRQDLPNAKPQMKLYGKLAYEELKKFSNDL